MVIPNSFNRNAERKERHLVSYDDHGRRDGKLMITGRLS